MADLPFCDDTASSIDPRPFESRMDFEEFAANTCQHLTYRRDLDLIIGAPDGSIAGTAPFGLDPAASGWAELEPLGIVPERTAAGVAQILSLDA
jgi:hypothetical protein